ncbi:hypothetical protein AtubIFM55763_009162 [Aspergillus tubingensis]|nr:hypothetical protein AtubIFM55763_009162 [Aspergillus tubingensis]GLA96772.1 hypothetical protein AtubIFM57143_004252 [Aspergillus tubingensis]
MSFTRDLRPGLTLLTKFEQATNTTTPSTSKSQTLTTLYHRTLFRTLRLLLTQPIVQALSLYYGYIYGPRLPHPLDLPHPMENPIPPARQHRLPALPRSVHRLPPRRTNLRPSLRQDLPASQNLQPRHRQARIPPPTHDPRESARPHRLLYLRLVRTVQNPLDRSRYRYCSAAHGRYIFQCTSAYLLEAYSVYGASANGGVYILRGLTGFGFPLFSPVMYRVLGYGWGNSLLGFVAVVIGCPIPWVLWWFGERLRRKSSFADEV